MLTVLALHPANGAIPLANIVFQRSARGFDRV